MCCGKGKVCGERVEVYGKECGVWEGVEVCGGRGGGVCERYRSVVGGVRCVVEGVRCVVEGVWCGERGGGVWEGYRGVVGWVRCVVRGWRCMGRSVVCGREWRCVVGGVEVCGRDIGVWWEG